jgi:hypothetical protein
MDEGASSMVLTATRAGTTFAESKNSGWKARFGLGRLQPYPTPSGPLVVPGHNKMAHILQVRRTTTARDGPQTVDAASILADAASVLWQENFRFQSHVDPLP